MNESIPSRIEKIPTPLLLAFLILSPFLTGIFSNPNLDKDLALWSAVLLIIGIIITIICFLYFDDREKIRVHKDNRQKLEIQKMQLEHQAKIYSIDTQAQIGQVEALGKVLPGFMSSFQKLAEISSDSKIQKMLDKYKIQ